MAQNPDMHENKKFDINSIVSGLKSLLNPETTPLVDPDDAVGVKLAEISEMMQALARTQTEQAENFARVNHLLNGLYKDIQRLRQTVTQANQAAAVTITTKPIAQSDVEPVTNKETAVSDETDKKPEV